MGGKGWEYAGGSTAALGGLALSVFGAPEIGIPLMLGGIGMDTGTGLGGTKGGIMGGLSGAAAGAGAGLLGGLLFDQSRQAQDRAFQQGVAAGRQGS